MKKKCLQPLTPEALYARVSSYRLDVDLSVSAHQPWQKTRTLTWRFHRGSRPPLLFRRPP